MAKRKRARNAARGTKADPNRGAAARPAMSVKTTRPTSDAPAPGMNSKREQLTLRIFTTVGIILIVVPFALLGASGILGFGGSMEALQESLRRDPSYTVSFISACAQPFVVYLLYLARKHYVRGDAGYTAANLIVLLCAEIALQNAVGFAGMLVLLWRTWPRCSTAMGPWARERGVGGVLADISGSLVALALGLVCTFAWIRLGA